MTTQGERHQKPTGQHGGPAAQHGGPAVQHGGPAGHAHRGRAGRRRLLAWSALVAVAACGSWIVAQPNPGDLIPGLGRTSAQNHPTAPVAGAAPADPLTEAQSFTADRYFPAQRTLDQGDFQAKRTVARQGDNCAEALQDRSHDVLHQLGCQAYVAVGFTRADQVVTSVTVLRFADAATAERARQALAAAPGVLAFAVPENQATAGPGTSADSKPLTASRTERAGHYLTVTTSRYADLRTATGTTTSDPVLDQASRAASYAAALPFIWM